MAMMPLWATVLSGRAAVAGENTWTVTAGLTSRVNVVASHPTDPNVLYAGAEDGFYRSADGGQSWVNTAGLVMGKYILSIAVDPQDGEKIYAGSSSGLYITSNGGAEWIQAEDPGQGILSVVTGGTPGLVLVGTLGRGVFISSDGGGQWNQSSDLQNAIVFALATTLFDEATVFAGTANGLHVSRDGGTTWNSLGSELTGVSVRAVVPSMEDPEILFAGTFEAGVFNSRDGGASWSNNAAGLTDLAIRGLAVSPADEILYAATSNSGFFRSTDGGDSWSSINEGLTGLNVRFIHVDGANADHVYSGGSAQGVFEITFAPQPQIRVSTDLIDFGAVALGDVEQRSLTIENTGTAQLDITGIGAGTPQTFSVSAPSLVVAAGESAVVIVRFVPQAEQSNDASVQDILTIHSNDQDNRVIEVPLTGTVTRPQLTVHPPSLDFGRLRLGQFMDTTLVLINEGNAPLRIDDVLSDDIAFRVLSFQATELGPGVLQEVTIRFMPLTRSRVDAALVVHTDRPGNPQEQVIVSGTGTAPDITVQPLALDFGTADLGRASSQILTISNSGNADLAIHELEMAGSEFRVDAVVSREEPLIVSPGDDIILEVSYVPLVSDTDEGVLTIVSDSPWAPGRLEVALKGSGGALDLSPEAATNVGSRPVDFVVVDLDSDGDNDVAVADSGGVHVLLNDGNGAFPDEFRRSYPGPSSSFGGWDRPVAIDAAPVFGGAPDLVIADSVAQTVSILTNDGTGHFDGPRRDIFIGHSVTDVTAVDVDADGDIDIAVTDGDIPTLTVLLNNDAGSFNARFSKAVEFGPSAVVAGNLNADGHSDLIVANRLSGTVSVLLNDQRGDFLPRQDVVSGLSPVSLAIVDYDADGDNDILSANRDSRDIAILNNLGAGVFFFNTTIPIGMRPVDIALSDLTADVFSDLAVAGDSSPFLAFLENQGGSGFVAKDILAASASTDAVAVADMNEDGSNDIVVLSASMATTQVFINSNTRRLDPPRPPGQVKAQDVPQDLGRQIQITWDAPELDEQIGRTTEYVISRSASTEDPFVELARVPAGHRQFVDEAATLSSTFYYFVTARNALLPSANSDTVSAASKPAPFFELELVNEPRISVGDTLKVRAFLTPAEHDIAGASLYLTFDDSSLTLIDANPALKAIVPFRVDTTIAQLSVVANRLHQGTTGKINVSLAEMSIPAGVEPVALGEIWFRTVKDRATTLTIDDEPSLNRRSAVVEALTGEWILPFIPLRPTQVAIRDFLLKGSVRLDGRSTPNLGTLTTFTFIDSSGRTLESPLNDEDRLAKGIQHTLNATGSFAFVQIPRGEYRIFAKPRSYLAGQVKGDSVTVGDSLSTTISVQWIKADSTVSTTLGAGDANEDNRIDLADYGVLVRYFGVSSSNQASWPGAIAADFNGDNVVDMEDFFLFAQNFGEVGMGFGSNLLTKPTQPAGQVSLVYSKDGESARLSGSDLGDIAGYAFLIEPGHGLTPGDLMAGLGRDLTEATVFSHRDLQTHMWPESGGVRIVAALRDPAEAVEDGSDPHDLLVLHLAGRDQSTTVRSAAVLHADGTVTFPSLTALAAYPAATALLPNYPNPFNPATTISYAIGTDFPEGASVELEIFDILGQRVGSLVNRVVPVGSHSAEWDGKDSSGRPAASGLYIYRLRTTPLNGSGASFEFTRRLLLIR